MTARAGAYYTEPYGPHKSTTYWNSSDTGGSGDTGDGYATKGRRHLMYIAEKVMPPIYSRAGLVNFDKYPTTGAGLGDLAYALNWEISGRDKNTYLTYFYSLKSINGVTKSTFVNDVKHDIFDYGAAVVVGVNTYVSSSSHLPNWTRSVGHAIAITGYNEDTDQFIYVDTCGKAGNGSSGNHNGGTYIISYQVMYDAVKAFGVGYVW